LISTQALGEPTLKKLAVKGENQTLYSTKHPILLNVSLGHPIIPKFLSGHKAGRKLKEKARTNKSSNFH